MDRSPEDLTHKGDWKICISLVLDNVGMGKGNKCVFEYGKNHCKGLRYCPHLLWLRELDFNIRSNFPMCIGLGCGKFWCLCWDVKERKIGLDFCTTCTNS